MASLRIDIEAIMNRATFEPESLIELGDLQGFRKLALVTGAGDSYVDLIDEDAPAWPLYQALNPMPIGNSLLWSLMLMDQRPDEVGAFQCLHSNLLAAGLDSLTFNRALYWAYQEHTYGYAEAFLAGKRATHQVQQSRRSFDRLTQRGRAAHLHLVVQPRAQERPLIRSATK